MPELPLSFKLFATICIISAVALVCWQDEITAAFDLLKDAYEENKLPDALPVVASMFSGKLDFLFLFIANTAALVITGAEKTRSAAQSMTGRSVHPRLQRRFCATRITSGD